MKEHDFRTLDPPVVRSMVRFVGFGPKPIPVRQDSFYDRECRRCGFLVEEGKDPAEMPEDWKDCDLMLVCFVMTC